MDHIFTSEVVAALIGALAGSLPALFSVWWTLRNTKETEREVSRRDMTLTISEQFLNAEFRDVRLSAWGFLSENDSLSISDILDLEDSRVQDIESVIGYLTKLEALGTSNLIDLKLTQNILGDELNSWINILVGSRAKENPASDWESSIKRVELLKRYRRPKDLR